MVPERPLTHAILEALADGEEHFIRDLAATFDVSAKKIADSGGHLVREGYATRDLGIYRATEKGLAVYNIVKDKKIADVQMTGHVRCALSYIAPCASMESHADKDVAERRRHAYDPCRRL